MICGVEICVIPWAPPASTVKSLQEANAKVWISLVTYKVSPIIAPPSICKAAIPFCPMVSNPDGCAPLDKYMLELKVAIFPLAWLIAPSSVAASLKSAKLLTCKVVVSESKKILPLGFMIIESVLRSPLSW